MISPLLLVEPLARGKARLDDRNRPQPDRPAPPPLKPEAQPPRRPIAGPKAGNATPSMAHCRAYRPFDGPLLGFVVPCEALRWPTVGAGSGCFGGAGCPRR